MILGDDMDNIKTLIDEKTLKNRVKEIAKEIEKDYEKKDINLICILKGSIMFTADLAREINRDIMIDFLRVSSYENTESKEINFVKGLMPNIEGKDIILIEDIIDSGKTMNFLVPYLKEMNPKSIKVCTLLDKPSRRTVPFTPDYIGFTIEDKFVLGYGLDYNQKYRNLNYIGYIEK
jgi:hypoxanthine phosphoribosyltransferase